MKTHKTPIVKEIRVWKCEINKKFITLCLDVDEAKTDRAKKELVYKYHQWLVKVFSNRRPEVVEKLKANHYHFKIQEFLQKYGLEI